MPDDCGSRKLYDPEKKAPVIVMIRDGGGVELRSGAQVETLPSGGRPTPGDPSEAA